MKRVLLVVCFFITFCFLSCNGKDVNVVSSETDNNLVSDDENSKEKVWSEQFAAWMQNAKVCEDNKKWILALDSYYMALSSCIGFEEADIAYKSYQELVDIIESGKPGRGSFESFSLYDGWKNLLIEAESYGNTVFPYELFFGSFRKSNLNYSERTADYFVPVSYHLSDLYFKTIGVVAKGYSNVDKSGWSDLPNEFPSTPISTDSLAIECKDKLKSSFAFSVGDMRFPDGNSVIPYEGVFEILDNNGTVLAESEPYIIGSKTADTIKVTGLLPGLFSYQEALISFKNVNENAIREIDAGNARIQLKSLKILYGKVTAESDIDAVRYIDGKNRADAGFVLFDIHFQGSKAISKARFYFANKAIKNEVVEGPVGCILLEPKEIFQLIFADNNVFLNETNFIILCNELSKMFGREPVYKVNGSSEVCDIVANISSDSLTIDKNSNGFRAPTIKDINYCLSIFKDAPAFEKKSGFISDSYNYYLVGENSIDNANLLLYYQN